MKRLLAVLMVIMLLCACANRGKVEEPTPENENASPVAEEVAPNTSPSPEEELDVDIGDPSFATEEIPDGYSAVDFGGFRVLISENSFSACAPGEAVSVENNQFVGDNGEEKRVIAELLSAEIATDPDAPFAFYDEEYSSAVNTTDLTLNGFAAKKYHMQTTAEGPVPMKINTIFYCIDIDGEIVTFAYYPVMGMGGLHTQDIETVLNTIQ